MSGWNPELEARFEDWVERGIPPMRDDLRAALGEIRRLRTELSTARVDADFTRVELVKEQAWSARLREEKSALNLEVMKLHTTRRIGK